MHGIMLDMLRLIAKIDTSTFVDPVDLFVMAIVRVFFPILVNIDPRVRFKSTTGYCK